MGRERREFKRSSFNRDVNKLLIIATEGQKTEKEYFEGLISRKSHLYTKIYVEVLEKLNSNSSPSSVIRMLDSFKKEFLLREGDELWMVIDRDKQSWKIAEISEVATLVNQKNYNMAMSNPAFEVWLLLHVKDITRYSAGELQELFENRRLRRHRTRLDSELVEICGSYNKYSPNLDHFLPSVETAILRAEALIRDPNERWPDYFGTHVYKIVKKLIQIEED